MRHCKFWRRDILVRDNIKSSHSGYVTNPATQAVETSIYHGEPCLVLLVLHAISPSPRSRNQSSADWAAFAIMARGSYCQSPSYRGA